MNKTGAVLWSGIAALMLAGCGGGGGDGTPAQTFDMNAALANVLAQGVSFPDLQGSVGGVTFSGSISYQPATDGSFRGVLYRRSVEAITLSAPGYPPETFSETIFYTLDPTFMTGAVDDAGLQASFEPIGALPSAGAIGQSGPYLHAVGYAEDNQTVVGENWVNWSLEQDAPGTALACLGWVLATSELYEKDCFRIDPAGHVSGAVMYVYLGGSTLELR